MTPLPPSSGPHMIWVTAVEFARMMGKSPMWVTKSIANGYLSDAGLTVLLDTTSVSRGGQLRGGGCRRWYIHVPSNL